MEQLAQTKNPKWAEIFKHCFSNTLETTVKPQADGTTYVLTGDIPAMWLRDSVAQVRPYLLLAKEDHEIRAMITGLVKRQMDFISKDPYANAFNESPNAAGHQTDDTKMTPWTWERKYEIDSLCYPIQLAYLLYLNTGETSQFDDKFEDAIKSILTVWEIEIDHHQSGYHFKRDNAWRPEDTLTHDGFGPDFGVTGMTWSGFRPSDDATTYPYLIPSEMFAVVVLGYLEDIFTHIRPDNNEALKNRVTALKTQIDQGIHEFGFVKNAAGEKIYAYEVDGLGNQSLMDDANVPNLISAAYLGYCEKDDEHYLATRRSLLSKENPYYYKGTYLKGIGSSHTPKNYVWPIALAMQGLTAQSKKEQEEILNLLAETEAGTLAMHEGIDVDNPENYTREWFSWANMMFCELLMDYFDIRIVTKKQVLENN
ncbi:MAG: glycoside hydrolase family 125 protein [Streptococcaceae bacterium]|nr:glycoside hydrolase family 125 protein [Streptococcaceae bacterium]